MPPHGSLCLRRRYYVRRGSQAWARTSEWASPSASRRAQPPTPLSVTRVSRGEEGGGENVCGGVAAAASGHPAGASQEHPPHHIGGGAAGNCDTRGALSGDSSRDRSSLDAYPEAVSASVGRRRSVADSSQLLADDRRDGEHLTARAATTATYVFRVRNNREKVALLDAVVESLAASGQLQLQLHRPSGHTSAQVFDIENENNDGDDDDDDSGGQRARGASMRIIHVFPTEGSAKLSPVARRWDCSSSSSSSSSSSHPLQQEEEQQEEEELHPRCRYRQRLRFCRYGVTTVEALRDELVHHVDKTYASTFLLIDAMEDMVVDPTGRGPLLEHVLLMAPAELHVAGMLMMPAANEEEEERPDNGLVEW
eukprot:GHVU01210010.1.p1 GENE.GHVU01210010.1~~GHVU01210010.1.p1  ORF type:complete len:367 (+),score=71.97 GHVU01210010.1:1366-2466(+)